MSEVHIPERTAPQELPLVISFTRPIGDGGSIQLQTNVVQTVSQVELDALIDKLHHAGRRIAAHAALEAANNHLDQVNVSEAANMAQVQALNTLPDQQARLTENKNKLSAANQEIVQAGAIREKILHRIGLLMDELK
jgi:hypothetical protein